MVFVKALAQNGVFWHYSKKRKRAVDNGEAFHNLLTDLSKAIDCLNRELLIAKLYDYLSHIKQRTKINLSYSE